VVNRETYLTSWAEGELVLLDDAGCAMPWHIGCSCGFPSEAALAVVGPRIVEVWILWGPHGKRVQIYLSPCVDDSLVALLWVSHACIHACAGAAHGSRFRSLGRILGLDGAPLVHLITPEYEMRACAHFDRLGPFPHERLEIRRRPKRERRAPHRAMVCAECGCRSSMTDTELRRRPASCACTALLRPQPVPAAPEFVPTPARGLSAPTNPPGIKSIAYPVHGPAHDPTAARGRGRGACAVLVVEEK